ncbi:MAG: hypothetical protein GTO14_09535 [Anaerolineales bacterium]|nr:hypothetical protein [Anaerolineales bacterium]
MFRPTTHRITFALILLLPTGACQQTNPSVDSVSDPATATPAAVTESEEALPASGDPSVGGQKEFHGTYVLEIVPEETEARYIVEEEFFGKGFNTAIGVTNVIEGELTINIDGVPSVEGGEIRVDLRGLTSDERRRDNAIRQRWLESNSYPLAVFVPTAVEAFPVDFGFNEGEEVEFKLLGEMTIHDVTHSLTFDVLAVGSGDFLRGLAKTEFLMTDFGFDPPSIVNILAAEDDVIVELEFTLHNQG